MLVLPSGFGTHRYKSLGIIDHILYSELFGLYIKMKKIQKTAGENTEPELKPRRKNS